MSTEPLLLGLIRRMAEKEPGRDVRIVGGSGTTVSGFVREVDEWVADLLREAKAEALREGADELARRGHRSAVVQLRERADRIEAHR